jgi:hypothetical protein
MEGAQEIELMMVSLGLCLGRFHDFGGRTDFVKLERVVFG